MNGVLSTWSKTNGSSMQCIDRSLPLLHRRPPLEEVHVDRRPALRGLAFGDGVRRQPQRRIVGRHHQRQIARRGLGPVLPVQRHQAVRFGIVDAERPRHYARSARSSAGSLVQYGSSGLAYGTPSVSLEPQMIGTSAASADAAGSNGWTASVRPSLTGTKRKEMSPSSVGAPACPPARPPPPVSAAMIRSAGSCVSASACAGRSPRRRSSSSAATCPSVGSSAVMAVSASVP